MSIIKLKRVHKSQAIGRNIKVIKIIRKKGNKRKESRKISMILLSTLLALTTVSLIGVIYSAYFLQDRNREVPMPDKVFPEVPLASEIYDRNGEYLYRVFGDNSNSDKVSISEISSIVKASFMAAEDSEFYNHHGIDTQAMTRCLLTIIGNNGFCGGSTITQQLIKITTEQENRSIQTKIDEILLALKVERKFTKDQILEMYLSVTPYGSNITSIKTAAKFYFGVTDLRKLSLAQATMLASIINNPSNLSPTLGSDTTLAKEKLKERQTYVFNQLSLKIDSINAQLAKDTGEFTPITQEMIDSARKEDLTLQPPMLANIKAGHFVDYVLKKLQEGNYKKDQPFTLNDLKTGGYKIYTTLDYWSQTIAEKYVEQGGNQHEDLNMFNAALMTTVPSTGEILTMAGSKSYYGNSEGCDGNNENCKFDPQVNIFTTLQSPGSTNKPLGYYAAIRDQKITPSSILADIPTDFNGYKPKDWDSKYIGYGSAIDMLRQSRNIPAVQVLQMIGVNNYLETARSFGYTTYTNNDNYGSSVILGGAEVQLIEHAQAYGIFANGGDLAKLNPILKIEDKDGNIIYEASSGRTTVANGNAIAQVNRMLYRLDTLGSPIYWDERDIAGKTGTTEDNKDALLVIYSPDFVTLAWGGNNNNEPLNQYMGWPGYLITPWVRDYMRELGWGGRFTQKTRFAF